MAPFNLTTESVAGSVVWKYTCDKCGRIARCEMYQSPTGDWRLSAGGVVCGWCHDRVKVDDGT